MDFSVAREPGAIKVSEASSPGVGIWIYGGAKLGSDGGRARNERADGTRKYSLHNIFNEASAASF